MFSMYRRLLGAMMFAGVSLCIATNHGEAQEPSPAVPAAKSQAVTPEQAGPELKQRPPATAEEKAAEGRMRLDVVVTDKSGNPVAGLDAKDFTLQDDGKPQTIAAFKASDGKALDGAPGNPDSRVSVFLVMDTVNSGLVDLSFMREEIEKFLRQNGGQLLQPTTVLLLTDAGFEAVGETSKDGNKLADAVHAIQSQVHTIHSAAGREAQIERYQLSGKALAAIAAREATAPGRKMMIWIGPGWPILRATGTTYSAREHELNYDAIASLLNQLREARMVLCSAGGGGAFAVQDLMTPVKSPMEATAANLALQVLALESGGRTLDAGNRSHPAKQLNACMQELGAYYTLTFKPPAGEKPYSYRALKVTVDRHGMKVNTNAGYYAEP
ncbi:MAG TPA: VWA domain-containing protein [Acidobacteriaceae bacterium]|nr:VWA domain-containing protein [Acidobacteriaceae bacterium]